MTRTRHRELERLRAQVAELERQLGEQAARANAAIAAAQERAYWLDRWHLDLNALMATRRGAQFRALMRAARSAGPARAHGQAAPARMTPEFSVDRPRQGRGALPRGAARRRAAPQGEDVEVLVIDSGSRDDSVAIARAAGAEVLEIAPGGVRPRPHAQPRRRAHARAT